MSTSDVPDPPDESYRHRETVRLPRSTAAAIQRLVDEGEYPNRSAVIRAGVRLLIDRESDDSVDSEATAGSAGDRDRSR
jgi:Arc/MetJ-type ribon-helix-helix transcriptional regulator